MEQDNQDGSLKDFMIEGSTKLDLNKISEDFGQQGDIDTSLTNIESTDANVSFQCEGYEFHGTKTLFASSAAWEVEFKRQGGDIDEMTGVGAFKTIRIILPAINKMVRMIKEKDPVSPIFFDTDERRLKLYSRAIGKIVKPR